MGCAVSRPVILDSTQLDTLNGKISAIEKSKPIEANVTVDATIDRSVHPALVKVALRQ